MNFASKNTMKLLLLSFIGIAAAFPSAASLNVADYHPSNVINRDVFVIGGGSAGTYTAIQLRGMNKTVAVVEVQDRLGGHTQTYRDPATNGELHQPKQRLPS